MLKYFVSRILLLIPMLLVIGLVVFIGLELAPGDPITAMIPPDQLSSMTLEDIEAMRESLGLNDPMLVRYFRWLFNLIKGDMGYSVVTGTPIASIIQNLLPATIKLTFAALIISTNGPITSVISTNGRLMQLNKELTAYRSIQNKKSPRSFLSGIF
jgi:peptide/nickel transport system permease protein